ncbi:MAG: hypothetical protein ACXWAT_04825 [Methylobacter sp.]
MKCKSAEPVLGIDTLEQFRNDEFEAVDLTKESPNLISRNWAMMMI